MVNNEEIHHFDRNSKHILTNGFMFDILIMFLRVCEDEI